MAVLAPAAARESAPAAPPRPAWPWALAWLAVAVVTGVLVRLPGPAGVDPDGHASVAYFDRLASGQRLEDPLLSTPKPLLTVAHGLAFALTRDWRALTLLTVAAFALAVVALARAAGRLGGWTASGFTATALVGSGPFILQVSRGNSIIWALAGWAVAGDALTGPARRRWAVAAVALLLAALARGETWLLLPPVALWAVVAWRRGERRAVWLLLPLAALPLWMLHDLALTGDPLFSLGTPDRYTTVVSGWHPLSPADWVGLVGERYARTPLLTGLALLGAVWLARRRAWVWLAGIGVLVAGTLTLFGMYAWRGVYISFRYYDPSDAAVRLAAVFGAAWLLRLLAGRLPARLPARLPGAGAAAGLTAGGLVAALVCSPLTPADPGVRTILDHNQRLSGNAATAVEVLRPLVAGPGAPVVLAISPQRIRVAIELDRPLTQVRDLYLASRTGQELEQLLASASFVFHDPDAGPPVPGYAPLSTTTAVRIGDVRVIPVRTDPGRGLYVLRVEPADEP